MPVARLWFHANETSVLKHMYLYTRIFILINEYFESPQQTRSFSMMNFDRFHPPVHKADAKLNMSNIKI